MTASLFPLHSPIKPYAWGSHTSLALIRGVAPPGGPEAELWMGTHPGGPSLADTPSGPRPLGELIAEAPLAMLGKDVTNTFGPRLPFLLKILAAAEPLSLQAHPSLERARLGFAREKARGTPMDAPERSYKDDSHKPELICALTPFHALVGFRPIDDTRRLLEALEVRALAPLLEALALSPPKRALYTFFALAVTASPAYRRELAEATRFACNERQSSVSEFSRELAWGARIGALYPGDPGIVVALALNLVALEPGQALYLPAGNLHAYLEGTGVEIMASSDNVLRGGLTKKHVDVPELLEVLDFQAAPATLVPSTHHDGELRYITPAREFALSRIDLDGSSVTVGPILGPEILLVTQGTAEAQRGGERAALAAGSAVFVAAEGGPLVLTGHGTAFRARVNDTPPG